LMKYSSLLKYDLVSTVIGLPSRRRFEGACYLSQILQEESAAQAYLHETAISFMQLTFLGTTLKMRLPSFSKTSVNLPIDTALYPWRTESSLRWDFEECTDVFWL
jgi:hypothetical protein